MYTNKAKEQLARTYEIAALRILKGKSFSCCGALTTISRLKGSLNEGELEKELFSKYFKPKYVDKDAAWFF